MMCNVRNASRRVGWRSRVRGAVGRRAVVRGVNDALDQVVSKETKWFIGCLVCAAWWALAFACCRIAYAAPALEVNGNFAGYDNGEEYKGYVVVDSPDNYQSTLCLIGEYGKLIQITTEQYETLSNPSTGGAFYELSQLWRKLGSNASGTEEYYPQWLALSEDFANGLVTVYGYGKVWAAVCTDDLIDQAKTDFNTIIDGGSIGGGSGSGGADSDGTYVYFLCNIDYGGDNVNTDIDGVAFTINMYNNLKEWANTKDTDLKLLFAVGYQNKLQNYRNNFLVRLIDNAPIQNNDSDYSLTLPINSYASNPLVNNANTGIYNTITYHDNTYVVITNQNLQTIIGGYSKLTSNTYLYSPRPVKKYYYGSLDGDIDTPDPDPSPDPWEPPTPTPDPPRNPTTPTPKDPITPDPPSPPRAPVGPTVPTPPQTPTVGDGGTFTVDIQGILDALDEHCIHIQTCLNSNFSGQNTFLGQLFSTYMAAIVDQIYNGDVSKIGAIGDVNDTIAQGFNEILSYWDEYVGWLDEKLDFKWPEMDAYDDANLLTWLKKIWVRQGTGDVNTRPVDPATDYSGFAGWLGVLYDAVALDVSDTSLTALTSSLSGLQHTFPFSLPWDVKQVLQSLDVSPATPSASIPSGTSGVSYDVDLHWMDSAMVSVRAFELLVFIVYVMVHTKDLFGYLMGE